MKEACRNKKEKQETCKLSSIKKSLMKMLSISFQLTQACQKKRERKIINKLWQTLCLSQEPIRLRPFIKMSYLKILNVLKEKFILKCLDPKRIQKGSVDLIDKGKDSLITMKQEIFGQRSISSTKKTNLNNSKELKLSTSQSNSLRSKGRQIPIKSKIKISTKLNNIFETTLKSLKIF